jgi:hypothetical protein
MTISAPFDGPANSRSGSPVALRPRLAAGLPFRGRLRLLQLLQMRHSWKQNRYRSLAGHSTFAVTQKAILIGRTRNYATLKCSTTQGDLILLIPWGRPAGTVRISTCNAERKGFSDLSPKRLIVLSNGILSSRARAPRLPNSG